MREFRSIITLSILAGVLAGVLAGTLPLMTRTASETIKGLTEPAASTPAPTPAPPPAPAAQPADASTDWSTTAAIGIIVLAASVIIGMLIAIAWWFTSNHRMEKRAQQARRAARIELWQRGLTALTDTSDPPPRPHPVNADPTRGTTLMLRVAHASHTGSLYLVDVDPPAGIIELVRDTHLETCTAQDRIVFWFTRSTNRAFMFPNAMATELLLSTTRFTAHDVPILRGNVVITAVDATGHPAALTDLQIHALANSTLGKREQRILTRRFYRDMRSQRRRALAEHAADRDTRLSWPGQ